MTDLLMSAVTGAIAGVFWGATGLLKNRKAKDFKVDKKLFLATVIASGIVGAGLAWQGLTVDEGSLGSGVLALESVGLVELLKNLFKGLKA